MRVAVVDPSMFTPTYDDYLCSALTKAGIEVLLIGRPLRNTETIRANEYMFISHFYRLSENLLVRYGSRPAIRVFKGLEHIHDMTRLLAKLKEWHVDLIHFQWLVIPFIDLLFLKILRKHWPLVITAHDSNPFHLNPSSRLQMLAAFRAIRYFDHVIVLTQSARRRLVERGISADQITVIGLGLFRLTHQFSLQPELDNCQPCSRILFWGTIKPYKGLDILIRAFSELVRRGKVTPVLHIAGHPRMNVASLKMLAENLGIDKQIIWDLRFIEEDELPRILSQADVIVFPYRDADASAALMTVLPFGKPIVASRLGAFAELLKDGIHGYLVPPEDPAALADALEKVLEDPIAALEMGNQVRLLARALPSWTEIAEHTIRVYQRVLRAHKDPPNDPSNAACQNRIFLAGQGSEGKQ